MSDKQQFKITFLQAPNSGGSGVANDDPVSITLTKLNENGIPTGSPDFDISTGGGLDRSSVRDIVALLTRAAEGPVTVRNYRQGPSGIQFVGTVTVDGNF